MSFNQLPPAAWVPPAWVARGRAAFEGDVAGTVAFYSHGPLHHPIRVVVDLASATLAGVTAGMHVHGSPSGTSQPHTPDLPHYDPYLTGTHGLPGTPRAHHLGDLGNVSFDAQGVCRGEYDVHAPLFGSASMPLASIAGKPLVIHAATDDGTGDASGNSGGQVAHAQVEGFDQLHVWAACPVPAADGGPYATGCNQAVLRDGEPLPFDIDAVPIYDGSNAPHVHVARYLTA